MIKDNHKLFSGGISSHFQFKDEKEWQQDNEVFLLYFIFVVLL